MDGFVVSTPGDADKVYTLYFGERPTNTLYPFWWYIFVNGYQICWGNAPTFDNAVSQGSQKLVELKNQIRIPVAA